jgi:hypothetical protein
MSRLAVGLLFALAIAVGLGGLRMWKPRSESAEPPAKEKPPEKPRDQFAADRDPKAPPPATFDATRALGYLEEICKIGPRISGTDGMKKQQELLQKHFEAKGGKVSFQRFAARQRSKMQPVEMANLVVAWHPERPRRVIFCSHYDTRPIADQEEDQRRWREPFLSANDGGSGVALLMEMAHSIKDLKTEVGIDFVFFDGEEYIFDPTGDKYFFGSEHFAEGYRKARPKYQYVAAILLDMIGGKNARFPAEPNSLMLAGRLVEDVWQVAAQERCAAFVQRPGRTAVQDDHLALNHAGIPAIDIIDFDYPHWHRLSDVPANCSGDSLEQVARVLAAWVQRVR